MHSNAVGGNHAHLALVMPETWLALHPEITIGPQMFLFTPTDHLPNTTVF
jgi:hypothetical protein